MTQLACAVPRRRPTIARGRDKGLTAVPHLDCTNPREQNQHYSSTPQPASSTGVKQNTAKRPAMCKRRMTQPPPPPPLQRGYWIPGRLCERGRWACDRGGYASDTGVGPQPPAGTPRIGACVVLTPLAWRHQFTIMEATASVRSYITDHSSGSCAVACAVAGCCSWPSFLGESCTVTVHSASLGNPWSLFLMH